MVKSLRERTGVRKRETPCRSHMSSISRRTAPGCTSYRPHRYGPGLPPVRRRRIVLVAVVVALLVLLALPDPRFGWKHPGPGGAGPGSGVHRQGGRHVGFHRDPGGPGARRFADREARPRDRDQPCRAGGARLHSLTIVGGVRCPWCGVDDDRVVDSRPGRRGRRHPPAPRMSWLRSPLHDVRAGRRGPALGGEAQRTA